MSVDMSLITSLKHLNVSVKHVAHQITTSAHLDAHKVTDLAFQLINYRSKIEQFKDKSPEIFHVHSMEILTEMGHLINQAQKKLIKLAIPLLEENKQAFFEKINQVWANLNGCTINEPAFGERLFQVKKKDPVVLLALYECLAKDYALKHHFGPTHHHIEMIPEEY
jgi:hypothetical protein